MYTMVPFYRELTDIVCKRKQSVSVHVCVAWLQGYRIKRAAIEMNKYVPTPSTCTQSFLVNINNDIAIHAPPTQYIPVYMYPARACKPTTEHVLDK